MAERLLVGWNNELFHADAAADGGAECGTEHARPLQMRIKSKAVAPAGPTGECVFRRVYVTISVDGGYSVRVTPVLDGVPLAECAMVFSDPIALPTGVAKTYILEVPVARIDTARQTASGARGTSLEVLVETEPIGVETADGSMYYSAMFGTVHVETVSVMYQAGSEGV